MPQQQQPRDPLDEILREYGLDPREQEAIRRTMEEAGQPPKPPAVSPVLKPGEMRREPTEEERGIWERMVDPRRLVQTGLELGAGGPTPWGALSSYGMARLMEAATGGREEPEEYLSPYNVSNLVSGLTLGATRAIPFFNQATTMPRIFAKGALESTVPAAAYMARSKQQGQPIDPMSGAGMAMWGLPLTATAFGTPLMASSALAAREGWFPTSQRLVGQFERGQVPGIPTMPSEEEARAALRQRYEQTGTVEPAVKELGGIEGRMRGAEPARTLFELGAAEDEATKSAEEYARLKSQARGAQVGQFETQRPVEDRLIEVTRDIRQVPIRKRLLQEEIDTLRTEREQMPAGKASLTEKGQLTRRINAKQAELDGLDQELMDLTTDQAELRRQIGTGRQEFRLEQQPVREAVGEAKTKAKASQSMLESAQDDWDAVSKDVARQQELVKMLHESTGWDLRNLGRLERDTVRRLVKTNGPEFVNATFGEALRGNAKFDRQAMQNLAETLDTVLTEPEKGAVRRLSLMKIVDTFFDPRERKFHGFLAGTGTGEISPGGINQVGEKAINQIFGTTDTGAAWTNLQEAAKDMTELTKPGLKLTWANGSVMGAMAMFFWSSRFIEHHPLLGSTAAASGLLVSGVVSWPKMVNWIAKKHAERPTDALFKMLQKKTFYPAGGTQAGIAPIRQVPLQYMRQQRQAAEEPLEVPETIELPAERP